MNAFHRIPIWIFLNSCQTLNLPPKIFIVLGIVRLSSLIFFLIQGHFLPRCKTQHNIKNKKRPGTDSDLSFQNHFPGPVICLAGDIIGCLAGDPPPSAILIESFKSSTALLGFGDCCCCWKLDWGGCCCCWKLVWDIWNCSCWDCWDRAPIWSPPENGFCWSSCTSPSLAAWKNFWFYGKNWTERAMMVIDNWIFVIIIEFIN